MGLLTLRHYSPVSDVDVKEEGRLLHLLCQGGHYSAVLAARPCSRAAARDALHSLVLVGLFGMCHFWWAVGLMDPFEMGPYSTASDAPSTWSRTP